MAKLIDTFHLKGHVKAAGLSGEQLQGAFRELEDGKREAKFSVALVSDMSVLMTIVAERSGFHQWTLVPTLTVVLGPDIPGVTLQSLSDLLPERRVGSENGGGLGGVTRRLIDRSADTLNYAIERRVEMACQAA